MYCKKCGKQIDKDSKYCTHCGFEVIKELNTKSKEKIKRQSQKFTPSIKEPVIQGKRMGHFLIDSTILYFLLTPAAYVIGFLFAWIGLYDAMAIDYWSEEAAGYLVTFITAFLYYFLFEYYLNKTPGKMILKTKVVNKDGNRPSANELAVRTICRFIPLEQFSFTGSNNPVGWHDSISNTLVVEDF